MSRVRAEQRSTSLPVRPEGTYLVTGGLGELGLSTAQRLAEQGARRLVLIGRRILPDRSEWDDLSTDHPFARAVASISAMEHRGATVVVAAVDVAEPAALASSLTS